MKKIALLALVSLYCIPTFSSETLIEEVYELEESESLKSNKRLLNKSSVTIGPPSELDPPGGVGGNINDIIMTTNELIAIGKNVYEFIQDNKPIVNVTSEPISILPKDLKGDDLTAMSLSGWKDPAYKKYEIVYKHPLGFEVATIKFMVIFIYGGQYDGKGAYITGAHLKPIHVNADFTYEVNATFKVNSISNNGSPESPIATATLMLDYTVSNWFGNSFSSKMFLIDGNGRMKMIH